MKGFLNDLNFKMSKNLVTHLHEKIALAIRTFFHIQKCTMLVFP